VKPGTVTVLGSGTSMGVPTIGCGCAVCHSQDPHDRRTRPSVMVEWAGHRIVIDSGPDFREQAVREGIDRLDAVLYTHGHADHILGLDDLRPLTYPRVTGGTRLPLYARPETARVLQSVFRYVFDDNYKYGGIAKVELREIAGPFELLDLRVIPVPVIHGDAEIIGYRMGQFAYLTDFSTVPDESIAMLQGVQVVFLDALRHVPHLFHSHQPRPGAQRDGSDAAAGRAVGLRRVADRNRIRRLKPEDGAVLIFESLEEIPKDFGRAVVTVGNYDGIHLAHQKILRSVSERARVLDARSLLVTFDPHPARILKPHGGPPLITPIARKLELVAELGLDAVAVVPFTRDLSMMPPFEFAEEILSTRMHAVEVHEGYNFRFGHKAEGNIDRLIEFGTRLGFAVVAHEPIRWGDLVISSSNVRAVVLGGKVETARHLLGRPFSIDSYPGKGRGFGSKYTVPTVNLARYNELTPSLGVYVTDMRINGEQFQAVTNVGNRPTFGADSFAIESYILNFHPIELSSDTPIRMTFLHRLREEKKFETVEALKTQILRDVARAERYFRLRNSLGSNGSGAGRGSAR
jgi:riboflavin kinase/FMN adenylyltransferase